MTDQELLEKYIGLASRRHHEPYVKVGLAQREIWYMVKICLGIDRYKAVITLKYDYDLSDEQAAAAWLYINRNPLRAKMLANTHTGAYPEVFAIETTV